MAHLLAASEPDCYARPVGTGVTTVPWWAIPAITAGSTIFGALVAFLTSLWSDHRKFKADDRRQWDKEIRDVYLDVAKCLNTFDALHLRMNYLDEADLSNPGAWLRETKREAAAKHNMEQYPQIAPIEDELQSIYDRAEIIVDERLLKEIKSLMDTLEAIRASCSDGIYFDTMRTELAKQREAVLKRAKAALRRG